MMPPLNGGCRVHGHSQEYLTDPHHQPRMKHRRQQQPTAAPPPPRGFNQRRVMSHQQQTQAAVDTARRLFTSASRCNGDHHGHILCPEVSKALSGVMLIAEQKKRMEESTKVTNRLGRLTLRLNTFC